MYDERIDGAPVTADEGLMVPADADTTAKVEAVREIETLLPETEITFSHGQWLSSVTINFVAGKTYVVLWNGVEYTETAAPAADNGVSVVYVGNRAFLDNTADDNGVPFFIGTAQGQTMIASAEEAAVVGIRSEVNALRLECAGRVFDMPYTDAPKIVMNERILTKEDAYSSGYGFHEYEAEFSPIVEGKTYNLFINGDKYKRTASSVSDRPDAMAIVINDDKGVIFYHDELTGAGAAVQVTTGPLFGGNDWSSFSISVEEAEGAVHQMDAKYLPFLVSPNGIKYKLAVADDGTLSAAAVE